MFTLSRYLEEKSRGSSSGIYTSVIWKYRLRNVGQEKIGLHTTLFSILATYMWKLVWNGSSVVYVVLVEISADFLLQESVLLGIADFTETSCYKNQYF